jgi:hypothetical protein
LKSPVHGGNFVLRCVLFGLCYSTYVLLPLHLFEIQVVFSSEGKIVGFQPLSRVAVNQWADNPLARELYGGKKLSPGNF